MRVAACQLSDVQRDVPRALALIEPLADAWRNRHNEIRARHAEAARVWLLSSDVTGERDGLVCYGPTALIDPRGTVVRQVPLSTTGMLVADVALDAW